MSSAPSASSETTEPGVRRRIMHISTRLIVGGSQENTVLSCEGQADAGHAVSLVFGPIYGPEGSLLDRVRAHGGIETIETPRLVRELAPIKDWRCLRDLRALILGRHDQPPARAI